MKGVSRKKFYYIRKKDSKVKFRSIRRVWGRSCYGKDYRSIRVYS